MIAYSSSLTVPAVCCCFYDVVYRFSMNVLFVCTSSTFAQFDFFIRETLLWTNSLFIYETREWNLWCDDVNES